MPQARAAHDLCNKAQRIHRDAKQTADSFASLSEAASVFARIAAVSKPNHSGFKTLCNPARMMTADQILAQHEANVRG